MKKIILFVAVMMVGSFAWAQAPAIQWAKCYGGTLGDNASSVQQTNDGGYIIAGFSNSNDYDVSGNHGGNDFWIIKITDSGTIQWQKSLGGSGIDEAHSIEQTLDGGYIVVGSSESNDFDVSGNHGVADFWVVKLSNSGNIQWQKSIGGNGNETAYCVHQTQDQGYIIGGSSTSNNNDVTGNHGLEDYWIIKLNSNGDVQWKKCYGGSNDDHLSSICITNDDGYIVCGTTKSSDGDVNGNTVFQDDYWIVKLDPAGTIQWQKTVGGTSDDWATSVLQTKDNGYIVEGFSSSTDSNVVGNHGYYDFWVIKLTYSGVIQWQKCLGGSDLELPGTIIQTPDSGYVINGRSESNNGDVIGNHGKSDSWTIKLSKTGSIEWQKCLGSSSWDGSYDLKQTIDGGYIIAGYTSENDGNVTGHHGSSNYPDYWIVKLSKDSLVGINEIPTSSITISPNPTTSIITIKGITQPTIAVYNLMGQKVVSAEGSNEVNLAHLPVGMYMVQVFNKDMELVKSEKIILNR